MRPCPSKGQDSAPTTTAHAPVPPTGKPTQAPGQTSPIKWQAPQARGTTAVQPAERRPQTQ